MHIDVDPGWIMALFLTSIRVSTLFIMSPVFPFPDSAVMPRVFFALSLSLALVGTLQLAPAVAITPASVLSGVFAEIALGTVLSFAVHAAFGAFAVAGKIVDIQAGFGIGSVYDPVTRAGSPVFARLFNMVGVAVFFGMNGHHVLLRALAFSLRSSPPGQALTSWPVAAVLHQFALMFSLGVALIVPVMLALLLAEVGLAVVSRTLPQMSVFMVAVPAKLVLGVAALALSVQYMAAPMAHVYDAIFQFWQGVLVP